MYCYEFHGRKYRGRPPLDLRLFQSSTLFRVSTTRRTRPRNEKFQEIENEDEDVRDQLKIKSLGRDI